MTLENFYDMILDKFAESNKSNYNYIDSLVYEQLRNKYLMELKDE